MAIGKGVPTGILASVSGVNYNTLLYWVRSGMLSKEVSGKPWCQIYWSRKDVLTVYVAKELMAHGIGQEKATKVLKTKFHQFVVVSNKNQRHTAGCTADVVDVILGKKSCLVINADMLQRKIDRQFGKYWK